MSDNISKMIQAAQASKPADFSKHFNAEVGSRIIDNINDMRSSVIANAFGVPQAQQGNAE